MSEAKHTPGKWHPCPPKGGGYIIMASGINKVVCNSYSEGNSLEESLANCQLIAAAPDLLAACEAAEECISKIDPVNTPVLLPLRAAITKATKE